ncbi:transmembrane protein, putative [Medicago truncatula]|uniref:Transmembrane protein, putative n=1 Tax=Medicago truncatula TaxID=3880 RepID=G7KBI2_MEDTR|nr:transmembrane protein, putative [Medicago truncatula]
MSCEELPMHKVHDDMGFKDLPAFNLAMLARYSLLVANLGYNSSYVWRNFLCACFICLGWCAVVLIDDSSKRWNDALVQQVCGEDIYVVYSFSPTCPVDVGEVFGYFTLFTTRFTNSQVEFNRLQVNEVAHVFTGETTLSPSPNSYFDITHCINNLFLNEML